MSVAVKEKETILDFLDGNFETVSNVSAIAGLNEKGAGNISEFPFPTKKDEDWRFTDLKSISRSHFVPVSEAGAVSPGDISEYYLPEAANSRLVFVNGEFDGDLSSTSDIPENVIVGTLAENGDSDIIEKHLGAYTNYDEDQDVFAALNDANFKDGAFIYVPKETKVEVPIHILNVFTDAEKAFYATPRVLFVGEAYSKSTIVEEHVALVQNEYLNVTVNEFKLFEGAHVHHARIQRDSKKANHISRPIAHLDKYAEYHSYTICLGAKLFRNDPRVVQNDEEVDFTIDGLVLIDGEQIADTHSAIDHRHWHAKSHQLHKVVVNDKAHSIFNGKIFVREDSQKIDSFQENRNLLLSVDGTVHTKPQLEIFSDDVLCSHGATIGHLNEDEVFYLHSRGLTKKKARELLVYAFTLESIENMEVESVHKLLLDEVVKFTSRDEEFVSVGE
ncbi:MAG: Fe-S cluster assembly protein SufD [Gracilimonas sp.]|uniref:Fe-S cluster assembly protein SufD n=1 Tax=Gracilimonas TaxID=649462 RepID=UPI001B1F28F7|nr:Fe-S cluster assembly protein SufD [Gracilimonas sp.]MBO6586381.1 Fe-S cluster assembly protein SufD [Gracilimonas sp.]MBO6615038.1 Fe-S cluster assembly protein SufD [Gracilimonas sp.]